MRTLVWFRDKDLRVSDHLPLTVASRRGELVPLFVLEPHVFAPERAQMLPHHMQFLLEALASLSQNLEQRGAPLLVVSGRSSERVPELARRLRVDRVVAQRSVEPGGRERDDRMATALAVPFELYGGETLHTLGSLRTGAGRPYEVFTPFARAFRAKWRSSPPLAAPSRLVALQHDVPSTPLPSLRELGIAGNERLIQGGERAGKARLRAFVQEGIEHYAEARDCLGEEGTSRLSADLKFGTLSVRTVASLALAESSVGAERFMTELLWREFTHATLHEHPELLEQAFRPEYERGAWDTSEGHFAAWSEGRTGVPIVDAAARQLLLEGFVHNRARMLAASFLTKHLRQHYRRGEQHYLRYLVDGDAAQNNFGWQWSAGCGVGAQPYFRVMNPVTQAEKFDSAGRYVRRYLPELAQLPDEYVQRPWEAPSAVLEGVGVRLGVDYPNPIVDLATARIEYLRLAHGVFRKS